MGGLASTKIARARASLVFDQPFFASLALKLRLVEDPGCRGIWCDGKTVGYNPAYLENLSDEEVKGLLCHEILHLACAHHLRRDDRDDKLWNMACDYAINPILIEAGFTLPGRYLDDPEKRGQSAETIYAALDAERDEQKGGGRDLPKLTINGQEEAQGAGSGELGGGQGEGGAGEENDRKPEQKGDAPGGGQGEDGGEDAKRQDAAMTGEIRDAPQGLSDGEGPDNSGGAGEALEKERELRMSLAQALQKARECGQLPGAVARLFGDATPRLDWRALLRRFLCENARNDFTWTRPNRRLLSAGLYLPGLKSAELDGIVLAIDSSGSVTEAEFSEFCAEASAALEEFESPITLFTCDAAITHEEELSRYDLPLRLAPMGGGGTDYGPVFDRIAKMGAAPSCLVYFTDLNVTSFPKDPGYPVLWVAPEAPQTPGDAPPFGELAVMRKSC